MYWKQEKILPGQRIAAFMQIEDGVRELVGFTVGHKRLLRSLVEAPKARDDYRGTGFTCTDLKISLIKLLAYHKRSCSGLAFAEKKKV